MLQACNTPVFAACFRGLPATVSPCALHQQEQQRGYRDMFLNKLLRGSDAVTGPIWRRFPRGATDDNEHFVEHRGASVCKEIACTRLADTGHPHVRNRHTSTAGTFTHWFEERRATGEAGAPAPGAVDGAATPLSLGRGTVDAAVATLSLPDAGAAAVADDWTLLSALSTALPSLPW